MKNSVDIEKVSKKLQGQIENLKNRLEKTAKASKEAVILRNEINSLKPTK
ncbi:MULTISPECIES: hypothetical protein [unclassified Imperialibacter]|nr:MULTISPECIES: hypothetical protein [unclassified Imperialibacter]CAD5264126.1 hypothetical protein IMPERIA89_30004 [Imperialibacter sp. 89]CAD5280209.1 hypothetical protein IMPERIA75_490004 [Imperialibacter sp. 75]VVT31729.1 hypothetical protein IMPR6_510017 [Imperialibacter sp. EC-SDR9]